MTRYEKSLNEWYQEILRRNGKSKLSLAKAFVCAFAMFLGDINPLFYSTIFPGTVYLEKFIYNFLSPIYQNHSHVINSIEYLKFERSYLLLLKELQTTLNKMDIVEPMEIFATFYHMVLNGFLSVEHTFKADDVDSSLFLSGSSIVAGFGVCRNLSFFLTDLLKEFNYSSHNIKMNLENQLLFRMTDDFFQQTIVGEIQQNSDIESKETGVRYNHMATLLADNNKSYIIDPMNNTFYLIHSNKVYPYGNVEEEIKTDLKKEFSIRKEKKLPWVDSSGIENIEALCLKYQNAKFKCEDSFYIFQKFYLEHKELYDEIVSNREDFNKKYIKIRALLRSL